MIKKKIIKIEKEEIISKSCDRCGAEVREGVLEDYTTEVISFSHLFGFGSNLDGIEISFDICKECLMEKLKDVNYRKKDYW